MGTMEAELTTVKLNREAARALVKDAREYFENGVHELYTSRDEGQRPTIAACTEIIGRVGQLVESSWRWPHKDTPYGKEEEWFVEFAFSDETMAWFEWARGQQAGYIADFDSGVHGLADLGVHAEQVYLLHVLDGIISRHGQGRGV